MKHFLSIVFAILLFNLPGNGQSNPEQSNPQKVQVIGHAHMDPVYRWRWNEIKDREIYKTFSDVLNELDEHPDLHFAQSSLLYYATIQKGFPNLFEDVRQSIKDKRWSVVGGQWVETDESMPSGESLIRQFLIANDYYSKNLDIESIDIAWSPDMFTGHQITIPKIYAGCGINTYVFSRAAPEGKKIFKWESKDGTQMLAYKIPDHYNPTYRKMPEYIKSWIEASGYDSPMITFGEGDHGGGPGDGDFKALKTVSEKSNLEFEFTSPKKYFDEMGKSGKTWPVQKGEFGIQPNGGQWLGNYTSHTKIKGLNRHYENKLLAAEKLTVIGTLHKGKPFYPREDFKEAWRILLFNQFHDIMAGTFTGLSANDIYKDYERLEQITSEQLNSGLENIGARINTEMDGIPLVVYNPHSWSVSQFVDVNVAFVKTPFAFRLKDPSGKDVPYSILNHSEDGLEYQISINAENVPPIGYKVYEVLEENAKAISSDIRVEKNQVENSNYIIKWNEAGLTSIFSKQLQKEVLKSDGNKLQLVEDNGSSWGMKLTGKEFSIQSLMAPKIVFQSPLKVTVKWEDHFQASKITRYMTLHKGSDQINFEMEVDWQSHNKLLKVVFSTNIEDGKAFYEQSYGYVQRKDSELDFPAQKWIDYSNERAGVALLNNGKYGFNINEGKLSMSIVRGSRDMDARMDVGIHSFKYSLMVHLSGWRDANLPQKGWELNQPLIAKQENQHPGEISGWVYADQSFPLEKSFFGIESDHVIISSLKTTQDAYFPNPVILRIVETEGRDDDVTVKLPYDATSVIECNHLEQKIEPRSALKVDGSQFKFKIGHDQIRTFMVQFSYATTTDE